MDAGFPIRTGAKVNHVKGSKTSPYYGDSHILHGVSLSVQEGEVVCLLGRNGAGKTTTILTIMGYLKPQPGRILYQDRDIATCRRIGWRDSASALCRRNEASSQA